MPRFLNQLKKVLYTVENGILTVLLLVMIGFAVVQIVLRNFLDTGILWGDPLLRLSVLWIALVGAMIASRSDNHIRIDLLTRYLSRKTKRYTRGLVTLFTSLVCMTVAYYSIQFVQWEYEDGMMAFAQVPSWIGVSIIPFAFGIIALRYFILFLLQFHSPQNQ